MNLDNDLNITYEYRKAKYWGEGLWQNCQRLPNAMLNIFHFHSTEKSNKPLFSYAHIIYYLTKNQLKEGWNIIVYEKNKALITKGPIIFLEIKGFKNLEELYQHLHRFDFDEEKPFTLIHEKGNRHFNIQKALSDTKFVRTFNLNKKIPYQDIGLCLGLLFLLTQTSEITKHPYPRDEFFKTIHYLETKISGQGLVKKISNRNGILKITFDKNTPNHVLKGLNHNVIASKN